jgi:SSS family solute:Na+ symporter
MGRQSRTSLANPVPDFNTVNAADYVLILLYFAILIWVGVYSARRNKNTEDYFRGGGKVPWLIAGMSNWVSGFSAFMFVAAAGFTYTHGAGALLIFTSAFWAYLIGYGFFAARWRRARIHTPLHFLTRRFSASTTYYYSLISIIPQIVGIGQGLYILCIFVSTALGFSDQTFVVAGLTLNGMEASILIVGTVMIVYTVIGGLWAAVLSDAVQSVIIVAMTLIIFVVSFLYLGGGNGFFAGMGRLFRDAPPGYFGLSGELANPWFLFAYFLNVMLGYNVGWALVQRYHSVPDERDAKKMAVLCAVLSLVGPLLWILPVMGSRVIFPDMQALWPTLAVPAEASYVSLALLLLPHGMIGFVVSAILSATLGQANDAFNWLAATLTRDVYVPVRKRYLGSEPTEKQQMRVARGTMLLVGCFGTLVALYIPRRPWHAVYANAVVVGPCVLPRGHWHGPYADGTRIVEGGRHGPEYGRGSSCRINRVFRFCLFLQSRRPPQRGDSPAGERLEETRTVGRKGFRPQRPPCVSPSRPGFAAPRCGPRSLLRHALDPHCTRIDQWNCGGFSAGPCGLASVYFTGPKGMSI